MDNADRNRLDRFREVERVFGEVCDLQGVEQARKLRDLCGDDAALLESVRSMLEADGQSHQMMDTRALLIELSEVDDSHPDRIGGFEIVRVLGEGGMGIVYEAVQVSPRRRVALKVIRQRSMHSKIRKRFEREADILAKLNHPAIATIYESGIAADGDRSTPYVSMELVDGVSITDFCRDRGLGLVEKIRLMRDVCRGVGYAHGVGVVHRDLKPSNILVDMDGRVKILDFGIAFDLEIGDRTQMTQTGQLLGTLHYMAPEQVDQQSHTTCTQSDVYALGLICYEILSGENPLHRHGSSMYELVRAIRDDEHDMLGTLDHVFRGDVETIVAKAVSREIPQRYVDASEMADDLDRYLNNQPIAARKPSTWYQLRKFSKRNPVLVGSVGVIILMLVVALLLIGNALRDANRERLIAQHEKNVQELMNAFLTDDLFAAGNPNFGGDADITLLDAMRVASAGIYDRFKEAPEAEALIRNRMGEQFRLMNEYDKALEQLKRSVELSDELDLSVDIRVDRRNSLSDVYMDIDDLESSMRVVEETDRIAEESPDLSTEIMIDTLIQHGSLLYHMVRAEDAVEYFERAVALGRAEAPEYEGTVSAISALAIVYTRLDRLEESKALHLEGVRRGTEMLGPEHPSTLVDRDNLAILYFKLGDYQKSVDEYRAVLEIRERVFGQDHVKTCLTNALLGQSLGYLGRYEEAEKYLLKGLDGVTRVLGDTHRYTSVTRSFLFRLYTAWGKLDEATSYAPADE
tara:strand:+ start:628332 stop:630572 length:2241 start_codon:yes stop_codon:yes gene_type:complete